MQFAGFLQVSEDFQLTHSIDRQVSQTGAEQVASTTFTIGATFKKDNFSGSLDVMVNKAHGTAGAFTISISGSFTAVPGKQNYKPASPSNHDRVTTEGQVRSGNTVTTAVGFAGSLQLKNGQVRWQLKNAQTMTMAISAADIKLGAARLDARFIIVGQGGQIVGVQMFFGIAF